jgi:hypothetical protein
MTSIAETKPSAGLSAPDRAPSRNFNLRAFIAGAGATTALIAGAIVVFASLATYVAFEGLPIGSGNENASQLTIGASDVTVSPRAARLLGGAAGAVAATAAASTATAPGAAGTAQGGGSGPGGDPGATPVDLPPSTAPTPTGPVSTAPTPTPETGSNGPVGGAVDNLDNATGLGLGPATDPVTGVADDTINGLGGGLENSQLGQGATDAVDDVTGGAVGGLLGD